ENYPARNDIEFVKHSGRLEGNGECAHQKYLFRVRKQMETNCYSGLAAARYSLPGYGNRSTARDSLRIHHRNLLICRNLTPRFNTQFGWYERVQQVGPAGAATTAGSTAGDGPPRAGVIYRNPQGDQFSGKPDTADTPVGCAAGGARPSGGD